MCVIAGIIVGLIVYIGIRALGLFRED